MIFSERDTSLKKEDFKKNEVLFFLLKIGDVITVRQSLKLRYDKNHILILGFG